MKTLLTMLATLSFAPSPPSASGQGGGLGADGGHTERKTEEGNGQARGRNECPPYDPELDADWVCADERIAPSTCRAFASVRDVDIEHIVAYAKAWPSSLPCEQAVAFVNGPLNITVAHLNVNRHRKRDKDIADCQPAMNARWFGAGGRNSWLAGGGHAPQERSTIVQDSTDRRTPPKVCSGPNRNV